LLGGWLTSSYSWESIFLINVPLAVILIVAAFIFIPNSRGRAGCKGVDIDGLQPSVIGLGALVFAIIKSADRACGTRLQDFSVFGLTWPATRAISVVPIFLLLGAGSLVLFVFWDRHRARVGRSALLDLFWIPTFSWGNITAPTVAIGEFALVFVLPLFL